MTYREPRFDGTVLGGYQPPTNGLSLAELLRRADAAGRSLPIELALHIAVGAIEAVARTHQLRGRDGKALVHGDISTAAVIISPHGEVQLGHRAGGDDRADDPLCCGGLLAELAGDSLPELEPIIERATNVGAGSGYAKLDELAADLAAVIRRAKLTSSNHRLAMWLGELAGTPVRIDPDEMATVAREPAPKPKWVLPRTVPAPARSAPLSESCSKTLPPHTPETPLQTPQTPRSHTPLAFAPVRVVEFLPAFGTTADVPPPRFRPARGSDVWATGRSTATMPAGQKTGQRVRNWALALSVGALIGAVASMLTFM